MDNCSLQSRRISVATFLRTAEIASLLANSPDRGPCPDAEPSADPWALCPRVDLSDHLNLVAVDFIGGDGAKGSIPSLEDDDRNHERGGEGGGEGVSIFAGHLFGSCLGGGGPSPARQDPAGPKTG